MKYAIWIIKWSLMYLGNLCILHHIMINILSIVRFTKTVLSIDIHPPFRHSRHKNESHISSVWKHMVKICHFTKTRTNDIFQNWSFLRKIPFLLIYFNHRFSQYFHVLTANVQVHTIGVYLQLSYILFRHIFQMLWKQK